MFTMNSSLFFLLGVFLSIISEGFGLLCYQCVSTHAGCGTPFKWMWYPTKSCPEDNDVCVKIIEKKGVTEVITRDCLSSVIGLRTDIPADRYEGCRSAAVDVRLAHYVNNSIKELDIKRNYYDSTTWCFCYFDHWCNSSSTLTSSVSFITFCFVLIYLKQILQ